MTGFKFNYKTKNSGLTGVLKYMRYIALLTLPERRQRVQALIRRVLPLTIALTRFILGFQVLFDRLCEWESLIPKDIFLAQISHFAMNLHLL